MKTLTQWIRRSLVKISVLLLVMVILLTNIGITLLFNSYVAHIRENEKMLVVRTATEALDDGSIESSEGTSLRQAANQSGVLAKVFTDQKVLVFDSSIGNNGNKRLLLNQQKEVIDPADLIYKTIEISSGGQLYSVVIGYEKNWQFSQEDMAFVLAINGIFLAVTLLAIPILWAVSRSMAVALSEPMIAIMNATKHIEKGQYTELDLKTSEAVELSELSTAVENLAHQLEKQEKLRKRMTSDISHELRNPLAVLKSQFEGLADGVLEATPERYDRLNHEIHRLTQLINDLNELAIVENELYQLDKQPIELSECLEEIAEDYKKILEAKNLRLIVSIEEKCFVFADESRFKQIVHNLLNNALKYTEEGSVTIALKKINQERYLIISDTGIGIPPEDLPFIFDRFYRTDLSRSRHTGGAGIGLAIVLQLVKSHGWQIQVDSKLGKGTVFTLIIKDE